MGGDSAVAAELRRLEREGRTGVLRAGRDGAFHLNEGAVAFAESRCTAGLVRLISATGRTAPEAEQETLTATLGRPVMEMFALLAVFDAAYFLLGSAAEPEFDEGAPHWLAPICRLTPATLVHESARRRSRLAAEGAPPMVDRTPVVPVRRVRRQRVVLTGLQAELLLNADGHRTPVDLARELGRTTFGCLLAVSELSAAGLLVRSAGEPPAEPVLPPRRRGSTLRERPGAPPPVQWEPVDHDVLVRLRKALDELA